LCGNIESRRKWDQFWDNQAKSQAFVPTLIRWGRSYFSRIYVNFIKRYRVGASLLEAGCGSAVSTLQLASETREITRVTLLDFAPQSIIVAKRNSLVYGVDTNCIVADVHLMPFQAFSFDFVWNMGLLEHFENPFPVIKEMERVTKKGGKVAAIVPFRYAPLIFLSALLRPLTNVTRKYEKFQTWEETRRVSSSKHLQQEFEEAGLEKVEVVLVPGSFFLTVAVIGEKASN